MIVRYMLTVASLLDQGYVRGHHLRGQGRGQCLSGSVGLGLMNYACLRARFFYLSDSDTESMKICILSATVVFDDDSALAERY